MGRKKKKINKEEIAESCCFVCKDGGTLRICDYRDCLKAYHPDCVNKDQSFLEADDPWNCDWHSCFMCKKSPKFHCVCCTIAVCARCLCDANFPVVGVKKGFCPICLKLVAHIEGLSTEENIDFNDTNTYEFLFKSYWEKIRKEVGLTSEQVSHAYNRLNNGQNDICADDFYNGEEEIDDFESDDHLGSDYDDINDTGAEKSICGRKRGRKPSQQKVYVKSKKKEFVGWASRPLFDFLVSIGKDPSNELSQHDLVDIIAEYCKGKNLFDPENKKTILCDAKLQTIIKRKSVKRNNVYKHLNAHFAENFELSDKEVENDSGDEVGNALKICTRQRKSSSEKKSENKEIVESVQQKSCFASVISENIKHVYLRRSVVEELLKQPETFDANVMGCLVRTRSDPNDYMQKNDYQLLQVTGIKKASGNDKANLDITLQFLNIPKDVRIRELSDADFSEEECQDLQRRVKEGLVKRPTVEELEKKARSLHEVITKHQIASELALLEKKINQANEKGWRRELFDYVTRRELLRTPEEQSRLLLEIPEIIAEELEVEPTNDFLSKKDEHKEDGSLEKETSEKPNSQRVNSRVNRFHCLPNGDFLSKKGEHKEDGLPGKETSETPHSQRVIPQVNGCHRLPNVGAESTGSDEIYNSAEDEVSASGPIRSGFASEDYQGREVSSENYKIDEEEKRRASEATKQNHLKESHLEPLYEEHLDNPSQGRLNFPLSEKQCQPGSVMFEETQVESVANEDKEVKNKQIEQALNIMEISDDEEPQIVSREHGHAKKVCEPIVEVIELSDDEEQASTAAVNEQVPEDPNSPIWHCVSAHGRTSGPHPMSVLKQWMDSSSRELKVRVWKIGQSPEEAVLLADAIRQVYGTQ